MSKKVQESIGHSEDSLNFRFVSYWFSGAKASDRQMFFSEHKDALYVSQYFIFGST